MIAIRLGEVAISPESLSATTTQGMILEGRIPADAAGAVDISVTSPTGKKAVWPNKYRIQPTIAIPAGAGQAQKGQSFSFVTTGVVPLAPAFSNVRVTIGGTATTPALDDRGMLSVVIPNELHAGTYPVVVITPGGEAETRVEVI